MRAVHAYNVLPSRVEDQCKPGFKWVLNDDSEQYHTQVEPSRAERSALPASMQRLATLHGGIHASIEDAARAADKIAHKLRRPTSNGLLSREERAKVDATSWKDLLAGLQGVNGSNFTNLKFKWVSFESHVQKYRCQISPSPAERDMLPSAIQRNGNLSGGVYASAEDAARAGDKIAHKLRRPASNGLLSKEEKAEVDATSWTDLLESFRLLTSSSSVNNFGFLRISFDSLAQKYVSHVYPTKAEIAGLPEAMQKQSCLHGGAHISAEDAARASDELEHKLGRASSNGLLSEEEKVQVDATSWADLIASFREIDRSKVSWDKQVKKWQATLLYGNRHIFVGHFPTEEAAARAYDCAAHHLYGSDAQLNFKDETPDPPDAQLLVRINRILKRESAAGRQQAEGGPGLDTAAEASEEAHASADQSEASAPPKQKKRGRRGQKQDGCDDAPTAASPQAAFGGHPGGQAEAGPQAAVSPSRSRALHLSAAADAEQHLPPHERELQLQQGQGRKRTKDAAEVTSRDEKRMRRQLAKAAPSASSPQEQQPGGDEEDAAAEATPRSKRRADAARGAGAELAEPSAVPSASFAQDQEPAGDKEDAAAEAVLRAKRRAERRADAAQDAGSELAKARAATAAAESRAEAAERRLAEAERKLQASEARAAAVVTLLSGTIGQGSAPR